MKSRESDPISYNSPTFGTPYERHDRPREPVVQSREEPVRSKSRFRRWLKRTLLILIVIVLVGVGVFGWKFYSEASKLTGDHNPISLLSTLLPQHLSTTNGRINILLAGYSVDDPGHQGASLTDSIMIVSVNPSTKKATLISVPRDLWVNIPGFGYAKINSAYEDGQSENFSQAGYFPGGMGLLEDVVSKDFGVNFNYYALLNYAAFEDAVNAVGGIRIDIASTDPRGLYDAYTHLQLPNGWVNLNGQQALDLARARGDNSAGDVSYGFAGADFERTLHQQQMLIALKQKATQLTSIFNPLTELRLIDAVGNNVITNLNIGQMLTMYRDTRGVSAGNIKGVTLNNYNNVDYLQNYYGYGQDSLVPAAGFDNYSQIQNLMNQVLYGE